MGDTTEKITYVIEIDAAKGTASAKKVADTFKDVADNQKKASSGSKEYGDALDKLAPGIQSTVGGLGGMLSSFKAMVLSPVGLFLGALAGAFTVIKAAIEKSEPALDFIEDVMTRISSTAEALLNNLHLVGDFFAHVLTGNLEAAGASFDQLTKEVKKGNDAAQQYLDTMRDLEDAEFAFKLANADTENQIKALIKASQNRNLTFDESAAKVREAMELERKMTETHQELTNKRTDADLNEIARKRGIFREEGEQFDAFLKRFTTSTEISGKEKEQIIALNDARKRAVSDSFAFQEKVENQLAAIADRKEAARIREEQQLEALIKLERDRAIAAEERAKKEQDALDKTVDRAAEVYDKKQQDAVDLDAQLAADQEADNKREQDAANLELKLSDEKTKKKQDEAKLDFLVGQQKLANASTVLNQIAGLIEKNSVAYKVLAISQALVDTYRAATAALAPPPIGAGPLFGPILAGTTIALGLANVAKISGFFEGGYTGRGNPREESRAVGSRPYVYHKDEYITPSRVLNTNEGRYHVSRLEALRMRGFSPSGMGGHFDGGFASPFDTAQIANQINNDRQLSTLINVVRQTSQKVLVIEDVEALIDQRIQVRESANTF
jgi:hypothetical protein